MTPGLHLEPFLDMAKPGIWPNNGVRHWVRNIAGDEVADPLLADDLSRADLKQLAGVNSGCPTVSVMWAILGWGKMHRRHARTFLIGQNRAVEICDDIRRGNVDCHGAFDSFSKSLDLMPGITAAFFSKLIFFLSPDHNGYIMDQWTSKSVNLIFDREVVVLGYSGHVSKRNSMANYVDFCGCVEWLAEAFPKNSPYQPVDAEWIEMALFSKGGRNADQWRKYVRDHWRK